jgi:DNA replication protein DnaC
MKSVAEVARAFGITPTEGVRTPYGLGSLLNLAPTETLERDLGILRASALDGDDQRVLRVEAMLADAHERDRLINERRALGAEYATCWCLGLGGQGEYVASILTESGPLASVLGEDGFPTRPVMAMRAYCECPDGETKAKFALEGVRKLHEDYRQALNRRASNEARLPRQYDGLTVETWAVRAKQAGGNETDIGAVLSVVAGWRDSAAAREVRSGPKSLLLAGGYGNGKSGLAAALGREALDAGRSVIYRKVAEVMAELRAAPWRARQEGREEAPITELEILRRCREVDLLILDDLGAEALVGAGVDRVVEALMFMIDGRLDDGVPTIITTNLNAQALTERVGERLVDRITSAGTTYLAVVRTPSLRSAVW